MGANILQFSKALKYNGVKSPKLYLLFRVNCFSLLMNMKHFFYWKDEKYLKNNTEKYFFNGSSINSANPSKAESFKCFPFENHMLSLDHPKTSLFTKLLKAKYKANCVIY